MKMSRIWLSTLPPDPNQARPLCEKDGHALWRTMPSIASTNATSPQTSAPSISSARRSVHRGGSSSTGRGSIPVLVLLLRLLVERRHAADLRDDRAGLGARPDPV